MKTIYRITMMAVLAAGTALAPLSTAAAGDETTEVVADDCQAKPVDGGIDLSATPRTCFEIYSITGQRLKSATVEGGTVKVELPKGCYIVRCAKWSKKVIVK